MFQSTGSDSARIRRYQQFVPPPGGSLAAAGAGNGSLFMLRGTLFSCHAAPDTTYFLCFLHAALEGQVAFEADQG